MFLYSSFYILNILMYFIVHSSKQQSILNFKTWTWEFEDFIEMS